jgi:2-iminobutanoate/2-iminopropanoate deaminase
LEKRVTVGKCKHKDKTEKEAIDLPSISYAPYSPCAKAGDFIFVSGQVGFKEQNTGKDIEGIEAQTRQCLDNTKGVLGSVGSCLSDVVKVTIFLRNMDDFAKMNEVYQSHFPEAKPARSTVITGLINPKMLIEIECIAYCPSV